MATQLGVCSGWVYFDMEKRYDTIRLGEVVRCALKLGFQTPAPGLGILVHPTPRVLRTGQACSTVVYLGRSIIAGCAISVTWMRAVLHTVLGEANKLFRPHELTIEG